MCIVVPYLFSNKQVIWMKKFHGKYFNLDQNFFISWFTREKSDLWSGSKKSSENDQMTGQLVIFELFFFF